VSVVRVAVVPHTHWDREWYAAFETFRGRLVELLDDLLPLLESDPGYRHFLLDGQVAVVDDYLAVRPEAEERLRRLVGAGRVAIGPWYTLPDEFCVSGETLVRDLQLGLSRADHLGGALPVGYLPDMFGHAAQMPQLLRLAGFEDAVVWRGVPAAVDRTAFWWSAPDGSTVRTEYLWHGYGVGAGVPDDAKALVARVRAVIDGLGPARHGPLLFLNGTDHERPQPWLGRVVAEANELAEDLEIRVMSLVDALGLEPAARGSRDGPDDLPAWTGELRSSARTNLLMGVVSNRVDLKRAAAAAERALERVAEPLSALWLEPGRWPGSLLADAWLDVIRNAAHDSSCACSVDDVCAAVAVRYTGARRTAESLADRALAGLAGRCAEPGLLVVNPTSRPRGGVIEVELPGEGPVPGGQVIGERRAVLADMVMDAEEAARWLSSWRSQQLDPTTFVLRVEVAEDADTVELTLHADDTLLTNLLVPPIRADVQERLAAAPGRRLHLRIEQPSRRRVLWRVEDVPGFGWVRWDPTPILTRPVEVRAEGSRDTTTAVLDNGLVTVRIDKASATFSIGDVSGLARVVESGDHGDTYNYSPPDHDTVVGKPVRVRVAVREAGPVRARVELHAVHDWPERVDEVERRRVGSLETVVTTEVELRAGEPFVRVRHAWNNRARDHRVRALLPLPSPASSSRAECAFAVVTRGLRAEGGPTERALATFPSRRFVSAGGLTVVHDGLLEYQLTDGGGGELDPDAAAAEALALTLVRATGMLSRVGLTSRPLPAGPSIPVEGAQMQGPVEARYAVCADPHVDPFALADEALVPLCTTRAPGGGADATASGAALTVEGAEVSAVLREGGDPGDLTVRLFNPTPDAAVARLPGRHGWVVDLRGRPLRPFEAEVGLGAWELATLRLAASP